MQPLLFQKFEKTASWNHSSSIIKTFYKVAHVWLHCTVIIKLAQHLMIQETVDQGLLSLPGSHMMDDALENISVITNAKKQVT